MDDLDALAASVLHLELDLRGALEEKARASPFAWLPIKTIDSYAALMRQRGVAPAARSRRGFLPAYRRAGGDPQAVAALWWARRNSFVRQHTAQQRLNSETLFAKRDGVRVPTDRHLALIAWAYSPRPDALLEQA